MNGDTVVMMHRYWSRMDMTFNISAVFDNEGHQQGLE